ncbi:TadE family protein [Amnibacterium flavum]
MVGVLLTFLFLGVLQLALALHVRNTVTDAASEGARFAALADSTLPAGAERTRYLISVAVGDGFAADVSARTTEWLGAPVAEVSVTAPLPLIGLWGLDGALEVTGHAPLEQLAD